MRIASRTIQQNVFYALGIVIMKSVSFFMLPFIASNISVDDFGRLEILTSFGSLGAIIVGFGLLNTLFRYAGEQTDKEAEQNVVAELTGINVMIACITLLVGFCTVHLFNAWLPGSLGEYNLKIIICMIALEGCIALPLGWLRMREKAFVFFLISTCRALIQAGLTIGFVSTGKGLEGILEAGLIAATCQAVVLMSLQYKQTGILFISKRCRKLLIYSYPMVGSGLAGFILTGLDRWLLASNVGTTALAEYAMAAKFSMIAALMLQPFLMWWSPRRFKVLNEPMGRVKAANFAAFGSALSLFIAVFVGLSGPIFIHIFLPEKYLTACQYVPYLVFIVAIKDSAELLNIGCYTGETTTGQFVINLIGSFVGGLALILLVPLFEIWGAIAALLLAQFIRLVLYYVVSQKALFLPYPNYRLLLIGCLAVLFLIEGARSRALYDQVLLLMLGTCVMALTLFKCSFILPAKGVARA